MGRRVKRNEPNALATVEFDKQTEARHRLGSILSGVWQPVLLRSRVGISSSLKRCWGIRTWVPPPKSIHARRRSQRV